jgi:hypothetical protein
MLNSLRGDHLAHQNPQAIEEVRRILMLNARSSDHSTRQMTALPLNSPPKCAIFRGESPAKALQ